VLGGGAHILSHDQIEAVLMRRAGYDVRVLPEEPLRNISVAVTRTAPSGRVMAPEERLTVEQAIRAQTIDAAWQLFSDDVVGSLEVGKYADLVVLDIERREAPPDLVRVQDFVRDSVRAALMKARPVPQFATEIRAHPTASPSLIAGGRVAPVVILTAFSPRDLVARARAASSASKASVWAAPGSAWT